MFDYETLKLIWWVLIGVLLIGFVITDGFDLGALMLLPFVARNNQERRVAINALGPHWDGNQVWLVTAAGALFAAWPIVYAISFSGFYWAMMLVLFALFFRPVGFEYRSKIDDPRWNSAWDWALFGASLIPALVFGVAFGNLFLGVPFEVDEFMRSTYHGNLFGLLNPFALLCGLVSVTLMLMHGGIYLQLRTDEDIARRARAYSSYAGLLMLICFLGAGAWLAFGIQGYHIVAMGSPNEALVVSEKIVMRSDSWLGNYARYPILIIAPFLAIFSTLLALFFVKIRRAGYAFIMSALAIIGVILTAGGSLFPMLMPSSISINDSLTMWDATSSEKTLNIMLIAAIIFIPIILAYTSWCYYKLWGKISKKAIEDNPVGHY